MVTLRGLVQRLDGKRWLVVVCFLVGFLLGHTFLPAIAAPDPNSLKVQGADTLGNLVQVAVTQPGAGTLTSTPLNGTSATAASANNVSLNAAAGQTTYCTGFQITGGGATATSTILVTLSGSTGSALQWKIVIPAGVTTSINPLIVTFNPPLAASTTNVSFNLTVPSFGAGNTDAAVSIEGFRQ